MSGEIDFKVAMDFKLDMKDVASREAAQRILRRMREATQALAALNSSLEAGTGAGFDLSSVDYKASMGYPTSLDDTDS